MRAREPDRAGEVDRDGVAIHYEVFGSGEPTLLLMGTFPVVDGHQWKIQVPFLARHFRVVTYDPRGNGRSGPARGGRGVHADRIVDDALAVMDATGTDAAVLVGLCTGALWSVMLQSASPDGCSAWSRSRRRSRWTRRSPTARGVRLRGRARHRRGLGQGEPGVLEARLEGYLRFTSAQLARSRTRPKLYDDLVGWGHETDAATISATTAQRAPLVPMTGRSGPSCAGRSTCPVLTIAGDRGPGHPAGRAQRWPS